MRQGLHFLVYLAHDDCYYVRVDADEDDVGRDDSDVDVDDENEDGDDD